MFTFSVIEIFSSIEGEGKRSGELTTFIRLAGCNLNCTYCDTMYAKEYVMGNVMELSCILQQVKDFGNRNVTVTGGEPLTHPNVNILLRELSDKFYDVNVETNGSTDVTPYFNEQFKNVWFTVDFKLKSSKMSKFMDHAQFAVLRDIDVIKFVVSDVEDLEQAAAVLTNIPATDERPYIYFSPCFGKIEMVDIVDFMAEKHYPPKVRVQYQLHKLIWDPSKRGV